MIIYRPNYAAAMRGQVSHRDKVQLIMFSYTSVYVISLLHWSWAGPSPHAAEAVT